jgi:hypothetical protein
MIVNLLCKWLAVYFEKLLFTLFWSSALVNENWMPPKTVADIHHREKG